MPARKRRRAVPLAMISATPTAVVGVLRARRITELAAVPELAEVLLDPDRKHTVVVVSQRKFDGTDAVDVDDLAATLAEDASIWAVQSGPLTRALTELLPPKTDIFNDALRIYPPHLDWLEDPYQSPLHILHHPRDIGHAVARAIEHVEELASSEYSTKARPQETGTLRQPVQRTGTVRAFLADDSRAIVAFDDGSQASICQEDLVSHLPVSWLVSQGQQVTGVVDPATQQMRCAVLPLDSRATRYSAGSLALGLVISVDSEKALVELGPGAVFPLAVTDISTNQLDSIRDLLTQGEVIIVRVGRDAGRVRLTMLDVDDDEEVMPPPVLTEGGPPWLEYGRNLVPVVEEPPLLSDATDPSKPSSTLTVAERGTALRDTQLALEMARSEIRTMREERLRLTTPTGSDPAVRTQAEVDSESLARLESDLHRVEQRNLHLTKQVAHLNEQLAELRKKLRTSRSAAPEQSASAAFPTSEARVRHDIYLAWVERIPASDKAAHPLGNFRVGAGFADSLDAFAADKRQKALKAVVDLLSMQPGALRARDPHPLRTSPAGDAPAVIRAGGSEVCWRLSIEQGAEAARRLHYWKCADGIIELCRVVVHEDFKP